MSSKSSNNLLIFYMQCKDMYKINDSLCRLAKQEFYDRRTGLPGDVKLDHSFNKVLQLIEHIEKSEYAMASEILADAFKEHEEMMSYCPRKKKTIRVHHTILNLCKHTINLLNRG